MIANFVDRRVTFLTELKLYRTFQLWHGTACIELSTCLTLQQAYISTYQADKMKQDTFASPLVFRLVGMKRS